MTIAIKTPPLTKKEFFTLLLIYGANADMDFSDSEKSYIINKFGEDIFQKMLKYYETVSEFQLLQFISDNRSFYFDTIENKKELSEELVSLFNIDGEFSRLEKGLYNFLIKILSVGL
jgi:GTP-sensing pleiotropic transcriptional regulator CodY